MTNYILRLLLFCLLVNGTVYSQKKRDILGSAYSLDKLKQNLYPGTQWVKFPSYKDRKSWESISSSHRSAIIADGDTALTYQWRLVPATSYLELARSGNRRIMEAVYAENVGALRKLVLAELAEGKGRFLDQIINGVWAFCEMTTWSNSAHLYMQKRGVGLPDVDDPIIDLSVGNTSVLLAWTHYFLHDEFDKVSPLISGRIRHEITGQVLNPFYARNDFWWMALEKEGGMVNNWNIWVNYNVLNCLLLMETDETKKIEGVYKTMRSADKFLNYYKDDGACEEGPSYWSHAGGMLYKYLALLSQATNGAVNKFDDPLVKNIGTYFTKAYINDGWYINYADASPRMNPDAGLVYSYGKAINDSLMTGFGAHLASRQNVKEQIGGETLEATLKNLFIRNEIIATTPAVPLLKEFWLSQTGIMGAREKEGSANGFYFSAIGGHNDESHNHNDVGTCILFYDGQPVLVDVGSGTYTRQTFGPERYSIWTMQSAYHNVPLINGIQQKAGKQYASKNARFSSTAITVTFAQDVSAAYPDSAQVKEWIRTYSLQKRKSFTITDTYSLTANNGKNALHFMTNNEVEKLSDGVLRLTAYNRSINLRYDPKKVNPVIESVPVTDARLSRNWPKLYRIVFNIISTKASGTNTLTFTASPSLTAKATQ